MSILHWYSQFSQQQQCLGSSSLLMSTLYGQLCHGLDGDFPHEGHNLGRRLRLGLCSLAIGFLLMFPVPSQGSPGTPFLELRTGITLALGH